MRPPLPIDAVRLSAEFEQAAALDILQWCYTTFDPQRIKFSTSFGAEGMVLLHMLVTLAKHPRVFTIDTGRLFPDTYNVWQEVVARYGIEIETFFPEAADIAALTRTQGPNLFYDSVEQRKQCCFVRKVKPLKKALADTDAWITGIRRGQSEARDAIAIVSYSHEHHLHKICPLAKWSETDVWEYIRNNNVPYDKTHDLGYMSIGCQPCTRPSRPAEGQRSCRWWWEKDTHKECGLHRAEEPPARAPRGEYTI
jgi:thioredoxin-dependent adenylylsulfate APS reductase